MDTCQNNIKNKKKEGLVVIVTNTIVNPSAMMILENG
jgi:hypothetical protein